MRYSVSELLLKCQVLAVSSYKQRYKIFWFVIILFESGK